MKFEVYGPFKLPLKKGRRRMLEPKDLRADFVEQTSKIMGGNKNLSETCGCYVFTIRKQGGARPWYIGKAERMTFSKECLNSRNIITLNGLLDDGHGQPELYLLPLLTGSGKFASPTTSKRVEVDYLESMLIGMGIQRNEKLTNISKTRMLRELEVVGFMHTKRLARGGAAKELRDIFGMK